MAIGTIQLQSEALERPTDYTVFLPDAKKAGPGPYAVLLQLHGKYDSHTSWLNKTSLVRYTEKLPLIVVMPDGGNFFWANLGQYLKYEDYLINDLWEHVNTTYQVRTDLRWAIGGLSMGGFGALRLGLKYPQKFGSIFAHSSVIPTQNELEQSHDFPQDVIPDLDIYALATKIDQVRMPSLGFDCGTEDVLIGHNRRFHAHLKKLDIPHTYAEHPGGHTWNYWDTHVQTALTQHAEALHLPLIAE